MTELYTQRKPQCSLQHCLQKPGCGSNLNAHHRGMDKEDVVHIHNGILFTHKKGMKLGHLQRCGWPKDYHIE